MPIKQLKNMYDLSQVASQNKEIGVGMLDANFDHLEEYVNTILLSEVEALLVRVADLEARLQALAEPVR